jgi:hypothetical protein
MVSHRRRAAVHEAGGSEGTTNVVGSGVVTADSGPEAVTETMVVSGEATESMVVSEEATESMAGSGEVTVSMVGSGEATVSAVATVDSEVVIEVIGAVIGVVSCSF